MDTKPDATFTKDQQGKISKTTVEPVNRKDLELDLVNAKLGLDMCHDALTAAQEQVDTTQAMLDRYDVAARQTKP